MSKATTKKRTTKKKAAPKKRPAALSEERTHKLTRPQLLKWRMLFAEMEGSGAKVEATQLKLKEAHRQFVQVVRSIPDVNALYRNVEGLTSSLEAQVKMFKEHKSEHSMYVSGLCEKLGMPGKHVSIDPDTGIVREIEQGSD